jgi:trehalose-phosphatase
MHRHPALEGVAGLLWRMVALASHRLLMLDYDGTLAPFTVVRSEARPLPRSIRLLERIADSGHTTVAIVSGRPLLELEGLIGKLPAIFVGEHGWERRAQNGSIIRRPVEPSAASAIEIAERSAREAGCGEFLERKRSAVVLHTCGLPERRARELQDRCVHAWEPLVSAVPLALDRIEGGVELRVRGRNKGTVVLSLLSQSVPGTLGVFVGDDRTDEDAFDAVRDLGFGLSVGHGRRPSLAQGYLESYESVPLFLEEWLRITGRPRRASRGVAGRGR